MENEKILGQFTTPELITELISELANGLSFSRILDPACGMGSLLDAVASRKALVEVVGIDKIQDVVSHAETLLKKHTSTPRLIVADFLVNSWGELGKFDLIVCNPPFGIRIEKEIENIKLRSGEAVFILTSLQLLEKDGHAFFVVPEGLLFSETLRPFRELLIKKYSLEAVISLPANAFQPYTGVKTSLLVVRNSSQSEKVFFAEYSERQALRAIVANFNQHTSNKNLSQGFLTEINSIHDNGDVWVYSRFRNQENIKAIKADSIFPMILLSELVTFEKKDFIDIETVLIQRVGYQPKVILKSELPEKANKKNYIECAVVGEKVLLQYLRLYLNSEQGKAQLFSLFGGSTLPSLRVQDLGSVYIELPDLSIQTQIVSTSQKLLEMSTAVQLATQSFYSHPFNYSDFLSLVEKFDIADGENLSFENLIFPLAASFRIATKGSPNVTSQLDSYFKLFEMVAVLNSIVLLSALPYELRDKYEKDIWTDNKSSYSKVSFGLWVALYRRLANVYKKIKDEKIDDQPFLQSFPLGEDFYLNLINQEVLRILDTIPEKRNKYGGAAHGGIIPEIVAQKAVSDLHPSLITVFEKLSNAYSSLDMIYPQSMKKSNWLYTIKVKKLLGTNYPFAEEEFQAEVDMNTESLYLIDPISNSWLELLPEFVKLIPCESCGHWSVFFYSKTDSKKTHYVSYQNEIHDFIGQPSGLLSLFI